MKAAIRVLVLPWDSSHLYSSAYTLSFTRPSSQWKRSQGRLQLILWTWNRQREVLQEAKKGVNMKTISFTTFERNCYVQRSWHRDSWTVNGEQHRRCFEIQSLNGKRGFIGHPQRLLMSCLVERFPEITKGVLWKDRSLNNTSLPVRVTRRAYESVPVLEHRCSNETSLTNIAGVLGTVNLVVRYYGLI